MTSVTSVELPGSKYKDEELHVEAAVLSTEVVFVAVAAARATLYASLTIYQQNNTGLF